jgi:hypothetical protein
MDYALDRLDEMVTGELSVHSLTVHSLEEQQASLLRERMIRETAIIRKYLWSIPHHAKNRKQLRMIVMQYYRSLNLLADTLKEYMESTDSNKPALLDLYESSLLCIEHLISLMQRHFSLWLQNTASAKSFYLYTHMNEAEISALLCAMIDTNVISNQSYSSFFEFVAPFLSTRHKQGLVAASMLKSKDKLNADMKKRVKDLLLEMARMIEKY